MSNSERYEIRIRDLEADLAAAHAAVGKKLADLTAARAAIERLRDQCVDQQQRIDTGVCSWGDHEELQAARADLVAARNEVFLTSQDRNKWATALEQAMIELAALRAHAAAATSLADYVADGLSGWTDELVNAYRTARTGAPDPGAERARLAVELAKAFIEWGPVLRGSQGIHNPALVRVKAASDAFREHDKVWRARAKEGT